MKKILTFLSSLFLVPTSILTVVSCETLSEAQQVKKYTARIKEVNYLRPYWYSNYKTIIDINWQHPTNEEIDIARNNPELQNFIIANAEWYLFQNLTTKVPNYQEYDTENVIINIYASDEVWFPPYYAAVNGWSVGFPPLQFVFFSRETKIYLNKQLAEYKPQ